MAVHGDAIGDGQAGIGGRPAIAAEPLCAITRDQSKITGGIGLEDLVQPSRGNEDVAGSVNRHGSRIDVRGKRNRAVRPAPPRTW